MTTVYTQLYIKQVMCSMRYHQPMQPQPIQQQHRMVAPASIIVPVNVYVEKLKMSLNEDGNHRYRQRHHRRCRSRRPRRQSTIRTTSREQQRCRKSLVIAKVVLIR